MPPIPAITLASPFRSYGTRNAAASSATATTTSCGCSKASSTRSPLDPGLELYPRELRSEIDQLNDLLYRNFNNGVYLAGFATAQAPYERAARRVFETLDEMEERLASRRYLFGPQPVETDWRFFVTLVRFDPVYYGHFKCNLRRIVDYPNLYGYLRDLYQIEGIAETVNFDHIKRHYYITQDEINPTRIVPIGPLQHLDAPHGRERLS